MRLRRWQVVGRCVLMAYSLAIAFWLVLTAVLAAHEYLPAAKAWSLPTSGFYGSALLAVFVFMCAGLLSWLVLVLLFVLALRRRLGANSVSQAAAIGCIAIPFWGATYYARRLRDMAAGQSGVTSQPER